MCHVSNEVCLALAVSLPLPVLHLPVNLTAHQQTASRGTQVNCRGSPLRSMRCYVKANPSILHFSDAVKCCGCSSCSHLPKTQWQARSAASKVIGACNRALSAEQTPQFFAQSFAATPPPPNPPLSPGPSPCPITQRALCHSTAAKVTGPLCCKLEPANRDFLAAQSPQAQTLTASCRRGHSCCRIIAHPFSPL
jgi:hypothetical protein